MCIFTPYYFCKPNPGGWTYFFDRLINIYKFCSFIMAGTYSCLCKRWCIMKKIRNILAVVACVMVLCVGCVSSYAYFTDKNSVTNTLTVSHFGIDLTEPTYTALPNSSETGIKLKGSKLVQGRDIPTDPKIQNKSTIPTYLFLQVDIPKANVMLVDSAPAVTNNAELFTYTIDSANWKLVKTEQVSGIVRKMYAYQKVVQTNGYTTNLFNSVRYADIVEGQISDVKQIKLVAYGIQQDGFSSVTDAYNNYNWSK